MSTIAPPIAGAGSVPAELAAADLELRDSPTPEPEPPEPVTEPEVTTEPGAEPAEGGQPTDESKEDGRVIPAHIRALKETNPDGYKKAKADFFDLRGRREIHSTVEAARKEHEALESAGGVEGLAKLHENGQFFKTAENQFLKGDPAFVKDLWEEDPIAAALHVQPMLDEFKTRDLAGYQALTARAWKSELDGVGFPSGMKNLLAAIEAGDKEGALAIAQSIEQWRQSIVQVAEKAEDPRVKTLLAERARQHEDREKTEQGEFLKGYKTDALNAVVEDGARTFDSFFRDRKLSADDRTDLLRDAFRVANQVVEADKEFVGQRDAHLKAGDAAAALRLTKARYAREMPNAVKKIARRYGLNAGPAQPTPGKGTPQQTKPVTPQGWTTVNERPSPDQISRVATESLGAKEGLDYAGMILSGRAVLKDGRKQTWAQLKRAS